VAPYSINEPVAIVLPGQSYGPDLPALAIPIDVLRGHGVAVTTVAYPDDDASLAPQITPALEGATRVTIVAKSIGTVAFGEISSLLPDEGDAIWITPLFGRAKVRDSVLAARWRCLSVYGTADPAHDPDAQVEVTAACGGVELAIDHADHRLVVEGDERATRAGFDALRLAVGEFLWPRSG
jgi:hypothetical protein